MELVLHSGGESRCPVVDTWWQTENWWILISPLPGATPLKPGSATRPLFGIQPALVDAEGNELEGEAEGNLVIKDSWPGQMRTIWGILSGLSKRICNLSGNVFHGRWCTP